MSTETFLQNLQPSIAAAGEKLRAVRKEDSFVFLIFSDLHMRTVEEESTQQLLAALEAADRVLSPDAVINLGDNPNMLGREIHISNEDLAALFMKLFDSMEAAVRCPILYIHGNHDAPGTDFFMPDFWNALTKKRRGHAEAVYDTEGSYCYWDIPRCHTRMVALSLPCGSDLEAEMPTPLWGFGNRQLQWLASTALDTDKQVIILVHVPLFYEYHGDRTSTLGVWTGNRAAESYIKDLCGEIADRDTAMDILNAFHLHESYDRDDLGIHLKASPETASLVACFSGHNHTDSFWTPGRATEKYTNRLPCHQVVTHAATFSYKQWERVHGMVLDAVVWTPSEGRFDIFRIGDGEDRHFSV